MELHLNIVKLELMLIIKLKLWMSNLNGSHTLIKYRNSSVVNEKLTKFTKVIMGLNPYALVNDIKLFLLQKYWKII